MSKKTDALFPLYKEKYEYELERKRYYDNLVNLPITLIAFLVAGVYIVISDSHVSTWFNTPRIILIVLIFLCIISGFIFLFQLYFTYRKRYEAFPDSLTVKSHYENIALVAAGQPNENKLIKSEFNNAIENWYIKVNTKNTATNDNRGDLYKNLNLALTLAYSLGFILFILFWVAKTEPAFTSKREQKSEKPISIQTTIINHQSAESAEEKPVRSKSRKAKGCPTIKKPNTLIDSILTHE